MPARAPPEEAMASEPRRDIESPCINVCMVDGESGLCLGCHRTLAEIGRWSGFAPAERRRIMETLPARRSRIRPEKLRLLR
jgi:uncharacterized protein